MTRSAISANADLRRSRICDGLRLKGTCSPWKSWANDRKLLTRAPEKRILHQNSQKINIFKNIKQRIYSFWRHFPHLRDAVIEVMVNRRHTRIYQMRYVEFGDWARNERDGGCKNFPEGYWASKWFFTMKKWTHLLEIEEYSMLET